MSFNVPTHEKSKLKKCRAGILHGCVDRKNPNNAHAHNGIRIKRDTMHKGKMRPHCVPMSETDCAFDQSPTKVRGSVWPSAFLMDVGHFDQQW
ncbi:hypothetical protein CEXT_762071 [Caerostris extrusa]|uniref:Uncharacterized protein n=1 Tax=Caerostris extrusa TaxID=172846 RepID=A0AAV4SLU2_CAEEX|nr:hypothetical protein CEXT_762071 [Caerostris extrusa]